MQQPLGAQAGVYSILQKLFRTLGRCPTVEEITGFAGFTSTGSASYHLDRLEAKGWIARDKKRWRNIRILVKDQMLNRLFYTLPVVAILVYGLTLVKAQTGIVVEQQIKGVNSTVPMIAVCVPANTGLCNWTPVKLGLGLRFNATTNEIEALSLTGTSSKPFTVFGTIQSDNSWSNPIEDSRITLSSVVEVERNGLRNYVNNDYTIVVTPGRVKIVTNRIWLGSDTVAFRIF